MKLDKVPIKGRNINNINLPDDEMIGYAALCIAILENKRPFPALKELQKRLKSEDLH